MSKRERHNRARTNSEKEDRRQAIIAAAFFYVGLEGFDKVTMAGLAERAGLAKGTLYLYFKTKEEVFLNLFSEVMSQWIDRVISGLEQGSEDEVLIDAIVEASRKTTLFLDLLKHLTITIEANVSDEQLLQARKTYLDQLGRLHTILMQRLGLSDEKAFMLNIAIMTVLQGAAHLDASAARTRENFPDDVRALFAVSKFEPAFRSAAEPLIKGIRLGY